MTIDIAKLGYEVDPRREIKRGTDDLKGMESQSKKTETASERMEKQFMRTREAALKMSNVGRSLTLGFTTPILAAATASAKLAIDAQETANKFDVVFRGSVERVNAELERLHDNVPLTTTQMKDLSSGVQDLLVPLGLARDEAADLSVQSLELAADLGSFNNAGTEQVLEAIKSSLAGSSEPMRRFGVDTRETRLQTIALNEGLIAQGQELNGAARAQAVFAAITADSSDALGDAARTAEDNAAQMRFIKRDITEAAEAIGQDLLPIVSDMIGGVRDFTKWLSELDDEARQNIILWGGIAAATGPALVGISAITRAIITLRTVLVAANPFLLIATGIGVAVTALLAFRQSESTTAEVLETVRQATVRLSEARGAGIPLALEAAKASRKLAEAELAAANAGLLAAQDFGKFREDVGEFFEIEGGVFDEFQSRIDESIRKIADIDKEITSATLRNQEYQKSIKDLNKPLQAVTKDTEDAANATDDFTDAAGNFIDVGADYVKQVEEWARADLEAAESLQSLVEQLDPAARDTRILAEAYEILDSALANGSISQDRYNQLLGEVPGLVEVAKTETEEYLTAFERGIERLDDVGSDFWRSFFEDGKFSLRGIKDLFLNTLAELANAAITRPILLSFGLGSGTAIAGSGLPGIAQSILGGGQSGFNVPGSDGFVGPVQPGSSGFSFGGIATGLGIAAATFLLPKLFSFLGGLFGKSPRLQVGGSNVGGIKATDSSDAVFDTALGGVQLDTRGLGGSEFMQELRQGIIDFDEAIAGILDSGQLATVTESLKSFDFEVKGKNLDPAQLFEARFDAVVQALGTEIANLVGSNGDLEARGARLESILAIEKQLDNLTIGDELTPVIRFLDSVAESGETLGETLQRVEQLNAEAKAYNDALQASVDILREYSDGNLLNEFNEGMALAGRTLSEALEQSGDDVRSLLATFDGSAESVAQLTSAIQNRYALELQFLRQVDAFINQSAAEFSSLRDRIINSQLSPEQRFDRDTLRAEEILASIPGITSLEELQAAQAELLRLVDGAFFSQDAFGQSVNEQQFLDFLETADRAFAERAEQFGEKLIEGSGELRGGVGGALSDTDIQFKELLTAQSDANVQAISDAGTAQVNAIEEVGKAVVQAVIQAGQSTQVYLVNGGTDQVNA